MITAVQCHAARILIGWSREQLSRVSSIAAATLFAFEQGTSELDASVNLQVQRALEQGGAVFIDEGPEGGAGVRLKFNRKDVRAIGRWEGEGGPVGEDDV